MDGCCVGVQLRPGKPLSNQCSPSHHKASAPRENYPDAVVRVCHPSPGKVDAEEILWLCNLATQQAPGLVGSPGE